MPSLFQTHNHIMNQDIYITDLPARVHGGFQPARGVGEGWIAVSYETANRSGTAIAAGCRSGAPELTLDLNLEGNYVLHLALGTQTSLRVWLDGESGYREFNTEHGGNGLLECRLHAADLTGKRLHIALKDDSRAAPAHLGYIRAERIETSHQSARNLVATNDGWSWVAMGELQSERDVSRFFAPLRDSDFGRMLWGPSGADFTGNHRTKVGTLAPLETTRAFRDCDRVHAETLRPFIESGGDILRAAVANARDVGIEIHFYIRMEAFFGPYPWDHTFTSRFFVEHPELRCRDEFGDEVMRLSYAYPEVQNHMIEYFEELLEYSPDGLCFAFNRGLPMMIAEPLVLDEFERLTGRRPNLPEEIDSDDMIAARTALMSGFMQRVHDLLAQRGLSLACIVKPDEHYNRVCGLDLEGLVTNDIFESIMVQSGGFHATEYSLHDSPFWQRLRDSGKTKIYPNGWGGSYDYVETARFLKDNIFGQGFAGGFFWDTENYTANPYNWHPIRQGGTTQFLDGTINGTIASPIIEQHTRIQGVKLDRYKPGMSY